MAESYQKTQADDKLALLRQQMVDSLVGDAGVTRQLKSLKTKDFKQQVQPMYAQVEHRAGSVTRIYKPTVWGRLTTSGPGGLTRGGYDQEKTEQQNKLRKSKAQQQKKANLATEVINTGSMTTVSPTTMWTTEGQMAIGGQDLSSTQNRRTVTQNKSLIAGGIAGMLNTATPTLASGSPTLAGSGLRSKYQKRKATPAPTITTPVPQ